MKKLLLLVFISALVSCKKESVGGPCWKCTFHGYINGVDQSYRDPKIHCGPEETIPHYEDENGQNLQFSCDLYP